MQGLEIPLTELMESKTYIGDNTMIKFGSPQEYIEPFIEKFNAVPGTEFIVNVSGRSANKENDSDKINQAFGRVAVIAKMPQQYCIHDHDTNIGITYALDIAKPVIKVYAGQNAWACTNLAIFGAKYVHSVDLMQNGPSVYPKIQEYLDSATEQLAKFQEIYERMNDRIFQGKEINEVIGYILRNASKDKGIGTTAVLSAVKDLDDTKSKYAIKEDKTSQWNIYAAITDYVTRKVDAFEKPSKTQLIGNLFVTNI